MSEPYILTLDAGTTGIKCAAFRRDGHAMCSRVESYPTYFLAPGWAQQRPREQLEAALRAIRFVLQSVDPHDAAALVFSGTMNGCIPIARDGRALYDNIIHSDTRTEAQCEKIRAAIPQQEFYRITGNRIDVHSGLPKYMWLKENCPDIYQQAAWFVNIKDYLYGCFTGVYGYTDRSDASLCNCLNMSTGDWAWDVLYACGLDVKKMPDLALSYDTSHGLCPEMAQQTGLPAGLPVAVGAGDGPCAAHGARAHSEGAAYMNIGSSAWVSPMSKKPIFDAKMRTFNYYDCDETCYNICGTVQCGSAASNWAIENLIYPGTKAEDCDFAALEALAQSVPPGAKGVMYLPTLMGERTPWWTAKVSGTLMGFTQFHTTAHVARAVYEGVMQSLNMCASILSENALPIKHLTLIGGGAKSALWGQMAADMMNVPVRIHETPHEATSLGAALTAGVGIGWYSDFAQAAQCIRSQRSYAPDPERALFYQRHLQVFRSLYPNMKTAYELLYDFQQTLNS